MSADGRRLSMRPNHQPGPESIPLRDRSPNIDASQEPSNTDRRRSEEGESHWNQRNGSPPWAAKNQPRGLSGGVALSEKQRLAQAGVAGELKKHNLALLLILVYAFIAILSWSITCVLSYQPIGVPTYFDQSGNYSRSHYETTDNWRKAASVGQSIVGVISIPVTSAICAKAVAVYCQTRSDTKTPSLTLRQMLVLADKGWSDLATLLNVMRPSTSRRTRSPLLILSAGLIAIGFIIPIIQTSIVGTEHVSALSMQDVDQATFLGNQIIPQVLRKLANDSVMDNIISSTITGTLGDKQPYLWSMDQDRSSIISVGQNLNKSSSFNDIPNTQFMAAFPVGTDTGVFRNLALRLNVSISCDLRPQSEFPSRCPGANPLAQTLTNINISTSTPFGDLGHPRYRARICAPGNILSSPWKDTANRQDISEELWLDYQRTLQPESELWGITDQGSNYTQHCYGNSTLGYFELPNYWNGHVVGPLLDTIPPNGPNLTYRNGDPQQLTAGTPLDVPPEGVPGPFLAAVLATFGPNTFFSATASNSNWTRTYSTQQLCAQLRYPFTGLASFYQQKTPPPSITDISWTPSSPLLQCPLTDRSDDPAPPLLAALMDWMPNFGDKDTATAALTLATYAAGNAILNVGPGEDSTGNYISTSPGTSIQKPTIPLGGVVAVSLLLALQITGLALLAVYASRSPTWTASLDAFAMLRLGAEIGRGGVPAVSALEAKDAPVLDERRGWVGDMEFEGGREAGFEVRELRLGGRGKVRDKVLYRMVRQKNRVYEAGVDLEGL